MKRKSIWVTILALALLVASLTLLVNFGIKVQPGQEESSTHIDASADAPAVPGEVVLTSEDYDVDWKIANLSDYDEPKDIYYFSLTLESGKYYKMKIKLNTSSLYDDFVYGYEQFGIGFLGQLYWEDAKDVAIMVDRNNNISSEATIYFNVGQTPSGLVTVDFYTHGSEDPEMMSDIDPESYQMVSFELYCIE